MSQLIPEKPRTVVWGFLHSRWFVIFSCTWWSLKKALERIKRGGRVLIGSACGEPQLLVKTLIDIAPNIADTEIIHFLDFGLASYTEERYTDKFRHNALFMGERVRGVMQEGRADYTPIFLSEIPQLIFSGP